VAGGAERSVVVAGFSPDGEADTEFGKDGVLRSGIDLYASDTASAMDMLRDGRLVVFGTSGGADFAKLAIARYLPDGAPDETLGSQGLLHLDLGSSGPGPFSLAVGLDGSIDVAGAWLGNGMLSVMRVTASGEPDQAFGASGVAATVLRGGYSVDRVADVVVDSKGRIITVGDSMYRTESIGRYLAITRHTAAGALDESFSTDGRHLVTAPDGASDLWARADVAEVTAHDRLLVAGQIDGSVGVIRLESDGTRDLSYGVDGIARISEDAEWVSALSTEPDGSALVAGDGFVARLSSDGAQVAVLADFHGLSALGMAQPGAIAVGPDGHLVVCGVSERDELLAVIRLHGDGTPDEGFGHAGAVTIGAAIDGLADTSCVGAWMRPDGRVVLAGSIATIAGSYPRATDFAVLGLLQNGDPDPSFGEGGFVRTDFSPSADPGSPSRDVAYDLLVGEGGSITIGGLATDRGIAIARFDSSGAPDRSFDQDGKVLIPARANWALDQELYLALSARGPLRLAMARRSDGRLVAATTGYQFQDYSDSQGTFLLHGLMETAASLLLPTAVR